VICDHNKWKERFLNKVINITDSYFFQPICAIVKIK